MALAINLNLENKECLVVGAGAVALRKTRKLLKNKARVKCVSMEFLLEFNELDIELVHRKFMREDVYNMDLVIAATNDDLVNHEVFKSCKQNKILCLCTDGKNQSDFTFMATREIDDIKVAVSTNNKAPKVAKVIADDLIKCINDDHKKMLKEEINRRNKG
ncbi:MAG: bifunctional precorrin-2 dehydrogenase/sirohydrochlorin ferrochelatase [Anaerorhabdus sp.]